MRALITGAASGLGRALAENLLRSGAAVTGFDLNETELKELADCWPQQFTARVVDFSDQLATSTQIDKLIDESNIDLVFLNAGVSATGRFEDIPVDAYTKLLQINVETPMVLALRLMTAGKINAGGTIIFISSLSHASGYPGASVYGASKDAIASYSRSIRRPCADKGVNVLAVFPGPVKTAHAERHAPKEADASRRMEPEELAKRILKAVKKQKTVLYPGAAAKLVHIAGKFFPNSMTKLMRRIIFEKLDRPIF